jgi:hypothetical protein
MMGPVRSSTGVAAVVINVIELHRDGSAVCCAVRRSVASFNTLPTRFGHRVIGQLEAAQDPHQIVNLAPGGGPARFEVLLHTQTSKESQDDTG